MRNLTWILPKEVTAKIFILSRPLPNLFITFPDPNHSKFPKLFLDLIIDEVPPKLLNSPFQPSNSFSCCFLSSTRKFSNLSSITYFSLLLSFTFSALPLLNFCFRHSISELCLSLRVLRATSIFILRLRSHACFSRAAINVALVCSSCASVYLS